MSVSAFGCPRCGTLLYAGTLVCPACGGLVYAHRLSELASEAQRQEMNNPLNAAQIWQQCLPLLPADSQQYQVVRDRVGVLLARMGMIGHQPVNAGSSPATVKDDPWPLAATKTGVSMLISIVIYASLFSADIFTGLKFASGFVLLILVHEMGHVLAMRYYGLRASAPIFIPFVGALINLRQRPKNAWEEAVVGIGGPVLGTVGALLCYAWYLQTGAPMALLFAYVGFLLNLFNMLPVPPLDGGRVTAAVSPWIWLPGLGLAAGRVVYDFVFRHQTDFILILILLFAWPRVKRTLMSRGSEAEYYRIGRKASWTMAGAYVGLSLVLAFFYFWVKPEAEKWLRIVL